MDYFDYGPWNLEQDSASDFDINRFLERSQKHEEQRLKDELQRIEQQLSDRENLRDQALEDFQSKLDWYVERLEAVYQLPGTQTDKRERLKQEIRDFYKEMRMERRTAWNDIQELEREKRDVERELSESKENDWITDLLDSELL